MLDRRTEALVRQALMHIARGSYVCTHALTYGYTFHESQSPCALSYANGDMCFRVRQTLRRCISERGNIGEISAYTNSHRVDLHTYRWFDSPDSSLAPTTHTHIHTYRDMCNLLSDILDDAVDDALAFFRMSNLKIYETPDSCS